MNECFHLLVLCGRGRKRSKTAEDIYKNDERIQVRAAGVSPSADRKVNEKDLLWADGILVMEKEQKNKVLSQFTHLEFPIIEVLYIPDDYERGDTELVALLEDKIEAFLAQNEGN